MEHVVKAGGSSRTKASTSDTATWNSQGARRSEHTTTAMGTVSRTAKSSGTSWRRHFDASTAAPRRVLLREVAAGVAAADVAAGVLLSGATPVGAAAGSTYPLLRIVRHPAVGADCFTISGCGRRGSGETWRRVLPGRLLRGQLREELVQVQDIVHGVRWGDGSFLQSRLGPQSASRTPSFCSRPAADELSHFSVSQFYK